jgi:hypothetical protein
MRPIKTITNASADLLEELRSALLGYVGGQAEADDPSLDELLRHALQGDEEAQADATSVWRRLSGRMVGPFGRLALEGPAGSTDPTIVSLVGNAPFGGGDGAAGGNLAPPPVSTRSCVMAQRPESLY